jgi:hypothetical protein
MVIIREKEQKTDTPVQSRATIIFYYLKRCSLLNNSAIAAFMEGLAGIVL